MIQPKTIPSLLAGLLLAGPCPAQILADFDTTAGPFRIVMDQFPFIPPALPSFKSPQAVANFMRLAEGTVPWIDPESGELRYETPFFDGLTFHRAVAGVEIGTGSPGGGGADHPGWIFQDDLRAANSGPYSVYMDNRDAAGNPQVNRNGSRILIYLPTPSAALHSRFTRLGYVDTTTAVPGTNGRITVSNISAAGPGTVTINSVTIRRGPDEISQGFDPDRWNLPETAPGQYRIQPVDNTLYLSWEDDGGSVTRFRGSLDLQTWLGTREAVQFPGQEPRGYDLRADLALFPRAFYRGVTTRYARWWSTERPLPRAVIQANIETVPGVSSVTIRYSFDVTGIGGTWAYVATGGGLYGGGELVVDSFAPDGPFRSILQVRGTNGHPPYRYTLHYDTDPSITTLYNPCRLTAQEIDESGPFPVVTATCRGLWTYTAPPP